MSVKLFRFSLVIRTPTRSLPVRAQNSMSIALYSMRYIPSFSARRARTKAVTASECSPVRVSGSSMRHWIGVGGRPTDTSASIRSISETRLHRSSGAVVPPAASQAR